MGRPPIPIGQHGDIYYTSKGGKWSALAYYRSHDGSLKRVQRTGATKSEARDKLVAKLHGKTGITNHVMVPMSGLVEQTLAYLRDTGRGSATVRAYRSAMQANIEVLGELDVRRVTTQDLQRVVSECRERMNESAAKQLRSALVAMFDMAILKGIVAANVAAPVRLLKRRERVVMEGEQETIDWAEILRAMDADAHAVAMLVPQSMRVLLWTAIRPGELVALRPQDIDATTRKIHVNSTVILDEKAKRIVRQAVPKSNSSNRRLSVPGEIMGMLVSMCGSSETIFCTTTGGLLHPSDLTSRWRKACKRLSVPYVRPKDVRSYVGTAIAESAGIEAATQQLGHVASSVTMRHYVKTSPSAPDSTRAIGLVVNRDL